MINTNYNDYLKHGTVALLDILGTKNMSNNKIENFIVKIIELYDKMDDLKVEISEIIFCPFTSKLVKVIEDSKYYNGNKTEDILRIKNLKYEMEIETFSDTILIAIYVNDQEIFRADDLLLFFSAVILAELFRHMFASTGLLLRGALSIGDYYLIKRNNRSMFLGPPMNEVAHLFETSNWGGIITTPSATLTLDQQDTLKAAKNQIDRFQNEEHGIEIDEDTQKLFNELSETININKDISPNFLIKYDVPQKSSFETDCYAVAWPIIEDENSIEIESKLKDFLDFTKFQKENISNDYYLKYRNTQTFYDSFKNKKMSLEDIKNKFNSLIY